MSWRQPFDINTVIGLRVLGEGPKPARIMIVGEFPGIDEGRRNRPFIGKSGQELMRFLNGYELPRREDVYLTNLSKTVAKDAKGFTFTTDDSIDLVREIQEVRPRIIVPLGFHATRFFLGPDATLEAVHGIPHESSRPGLQGVTILPGYNPAAGLRNPTLQALFAMDMRHLALFLKGQLPPRAVDEKPGTYTLLPPGLWISLPSRISMDSEGWVDDPWCLSWSGQAYKGEVVRYGSHDRFVSSLVHRQPQPPSITIHNSLHDLPVFRRFDLDLDALGIRFDDTMVMAYLLGLEPQGLKPLCYRHAGMIMDEYSEITAEAGQARALTWLVALYDSMPDKAVTLTKKAAVELGVWDKTRKDKYEPMKWPPLDENDTERARVKGLIGKMLEKPELETLRKRWANSRSREILVDELADLNEWEADPDEPTLDEVPITVSVPYAGRDADGTHRIFPHLDAQIDAYGLRDVYEVDLSIIPMIDRMQTVGLKADPEHFRSLSLMLAVEETMNHEAIAEMVGRPVNPNSGDQTAELLFDELKIHEKLVNVRLKKTDGGRYSTNDKTLEAIKLYHPVIPLIQDGREIRKIKGTYSDPIPKLLDRENRLHPNYRITRTDTGRLSAGKPNVLAFPKHSARGKLVRMGFICDDDHELGEWDLAQIEMCVFAHDSEDERMIAEILSGLDKHAATAGGVFGRPADIIMQEHEAKSGAGVGQRFAAKAINFGILMGITEHGLLDQMHKNGQTQYDLDDMVKLLAEWFKMYPGAKAYIARKHAEARRFGFVRDMWGRLRWLEGIHSDDEYIRAEAERMAQATPTQSGAQGIIKRAMRDVWPVLRSMRESFWVEPLLQVHDALVLEYLARERDVINAIMMAAMTNAVTLRVPVKSSASFGRRLGEL